MENLIPALEIDVVEPTHASEARRAAIRMARRLNFDETSEGRLALVVTEIATNILKHAKTGRIIVSPVVAFGELGVEGFGLDKGPGIADLQQSLRDGYSTAGSAGTGLGAVSRQSDSWDVYTSRDQGTVIRARVVPQSAHANSRRRFDCGAVVLPFPGCPESGDAWSSRDSEGRIEFLMVDGLGHGPAAADAARAPVEEFHRNARKGPELLSSIHDALRTTRGAAAALAEIDVARGEVAFTGVGNIAAIVLDADRHKHMVSMNGIVGHRMDRIREFRYPWSAGSTLVLHSDGLRTRWSLTDYPGLSAKSASLIAAVLMRDASRGNDDASVVVFRHLAGAHAA